MTIPVVANQAQAQVYRLNGAVKLHWKSWDDEYVVFDETSGRTYQLDPVRAYTLNALSDAPLSFEALLQDLSVTIGSDGADVRAMLQTILSEFATYGMLETP